MAKEGPSVHPLIPLVEQSVTAWIEEKNLKLKSRAEALFRKMVAYDALQNIGMNALQAATALDLDDYDSMIDELAKMEPRLLVLVATPSQNAVNELKERGQYHDPRLAPLREGDTLGKIPGHFFQEDTGQQDLGEHPADED